MATIFGLWSGPAAAFCGTFVASPGVSLTNQTSQIIVTRQDGRTTLSMANDYAGSATNFAMLIPVPVVLAESDITTVSPELFQRFDDYSAPRVVEYECSDFLWDGMDFATTTEAFLDDEVGWDPPTVVVEAEYAVGIYEIVILSATESSGLMDWLSANGYGVDAAAEDLLGEYIEGGQYFFAAKVSLEAAADESTFLEPLQFGYESDVFSLPVRLGTLNSPGVQDVVMYILTDSEDGSVGISNYTEFEIEDECMVDLVAAGGIDAYYGAEFEAEWAAVGTGEGWLKEYAWSTSSCDPCPTEKPTNDEVAEAGFEGDAWESYFTRIRLRYTADAAIEDVMLYTSGIRDSEQVRFIEYYSDLEDRFPVCGWGMLDEPGTCDDEEPGTIIWAEPDAMSDTDGGDDSSTTDGDESSDTSGGDDAADTSGGDDAADTTGGDESSDMTGGDDAADTSGGDDAADTTGGDDAADTTGGDDAADTAGGDDAADTTGGDDAADTAGDDDATDTDGGDDATDTDGGDDAADTTGGDDATDTDGGDDAADTTGGDDAADTDGGDDAADTTGGDDAADTTGGDDAADTSGGDDAADTSGGDDASGTTEDATTWDSSDSSNESKGGCSHAGATSFNWAWLLGAFALFGRRRR